ncbi:hypothetical protein PilKf_02272 [Pillotina sp. SPG140]
MKKNHGAFFGFAVLLMSAGIKREEESGGLLWK